MCLVPCLPSPGARCRIVRVLTSTVLTVTICRQVLFVVSSPLHHLRLVKEFPRVAIDRCLRFVLLTTNDRALGLLCALPTDRNAVPAGTRWESAKRVREMRRQRQAARQRTSMGAGRASVSAYALHPRAETAWRLRGRHTLPPNCCSRQIRGECLTAQLRLWGVGCRWSCCIPP